MYPHGPEKSRKMKIALNPFSIEIIQIGANHNVAWRRLGGEADFFELVSLRPIKAREPLILGSNPAEDLAEYFINYGNLSGDCLP